MMISPWVIYWIELLSEVDFFVGFAGAMLLVLSVMASMIYCLEDTKIPWYHIKRVSIIAVVLLVVATIIPSKETMYAILVVDQLTPENIEAMRAFGVETVQQLGDAIANSINKIEVK